MFLIDTNKPAVALKEMLLYAKPENVEVKTCCKKFYDIFYGFTRIILCKGFKAIVGLKKVLAYT